MKQDLERIAQQAYHRSQWSSGVVRRYHRERASIPAHFTEQVEHLYRLFLAPMTLWPFNIQEFLERVLDAIKSRRKLDAVTVTGCFKVTRYADHKGVIRRTMVPERNLRTNFDPDWKTEPGRFQAVFDTFCAKWNLYGMQKGKPLLQKLSVNLTPFGTMIFIPAYWSFDAKRDVDWGSITRLHKSRGQHRQGPSLAEGVEQRRANAAKLVELEAKAKAQKLRGAKRHEFLCKGLGWDLRTDPKRISRLRKLIA